MSKIVVHHEGRYAQPIRCRCDRGHGRNGSGYDEDVDADRLSTPRGLGKLATGGDGPCLGQERNGRISPFWFAAVPTVTWAPS